jgi:hypothetical protein
MNITDESLAIFWHLLHKSLVSNDPMIILPIGTLKRDGKVPKMCPLGSNLLRKILFPIGINQRRLIVAAREIMGRKSSKMYMNLLPILHLFLLLTLPLLTFLPFLPLLLLSNHLLVELLLKVSPKPN